MGLKDCHNFSDFRKLAKRKLPSPIFHYIDGAADDEVTYKRNTEAFNDVDLVPNVLRGVENVDLVPSLKATIQNPANLIEDAAADGWIRGGLPSRELSRDNDYFKRR